MHSWGPSGHPGTEPTPTPLGVDSLTYPLFTATGFRGDSSPLDDRRAAWAQCGLRDVDVLPEMKRCG